MIPIHPKRHLVAPRNWGEEPQDRYRYHLSNIAHTQGTFVDPHVSRLLINQAQFNVTNRDRVRF